MSALDSPIRQADQALARFASARNSTAAWRDEQRRRFDQARLEPAERTVRKLLAELRTAASEVARAQGAWQENH